MQLEFLKKYRKNFVGKKKFYGKEDYFFKFGDNVSLKEILRLYKMRNKAIRTDREIRFCNIPFGVSKKKIITKLGKPDLISKYNFFDTTCEILYYQKNMAYYNLIIQTFLLRNMFFYGVYNILDARSIDIINKVIAAKYLKNGYKNINCTNITIYDENDNRINLYIGNKKDLQYFSGNREIHQLLNQLKTKDEQIKEEAHNDIFKQLYDNF